MGFTGCINTTGIKAIPGRNSKWEERLVIPFLHFGMGIIHVKAARFMTDQLSIFVICIGTNAYIFILSL